MYLGTCSNISYSRIYCTIPVVDLQGKAVGRSVSAYMYMYMYFICKALKGIN